MIGSLLRILFGKELVLYDKHRQTLPILSNDFNKRKYIFLSTKVLTKIPFKSTTKIKFRIMYVVLSILQPKYILKINWLSTDSSLIKLWTRDHPTSKSIVIQHGAYLGGIVTDIPHRFTNCDIFLTWGAYFKQTFEDYNKGKSVKILDFGNPVYNQYNREIFKYTSDNNGKILLAPSGIKGERLERLLQLHDILIKLGFNVFLKEHNFQSRKFAEIKGVRKVSGNTYELLQKKEYDLIIADHGSLLLDAIFFKNRVLFYSCEGVLEAYTNNNYTKYLINLLHHVEKIKSQNDLYGIVSIEGQEKLFNDMITLASNKLCSKL